MPKKEKRERKKQDQRIVDFMMVINHIKNVDNSKNTQKKILREENDFFILHRWFFLKILFILWILCYNLKIVL